MNKKIRLKKNTTIAILALALFVLIGSISYGISIVNKKEVPVVPVSNNILKEKATPTKIVEKQADFANKAQSGMVDIANRKTAEFVGKVISVTEKTIIIKDIRSEQSKSVNFISSTEIFLFDVTGKNQVAGSLSDLLVQDQVKAEYDKETGNLVSLIVAKIKK